jgi:hypothetical protein
MATTVSSSRRGGWRPIGRLGERGRRLQWRRFGDLIIGAFGADPNFSYSGRVMSSLAKRAASRRIEPLDAHGSSGFKLNGVAVDDRSGRSVSAAGDVNGDGFGDLIIGADNADANGSNSGRATSSSAARWDRSPR